MNTTTIAQLSREMKDSNRYDTGFLWDSGKKYFDEYRMYDSVQVEMFFFGLNAALLKSGKGYKWSWLKKLANAFFLHNNWEDEYYLDSAYLDWYATAPEFSKRNG